MPLGMRSVAIRPLPFPGTSFKTYHEPSLRLHVCVCVHSVQALTGPGYMSRGALMEKNSGTACSAKEPSGHCLGKTLRLCCHLWNLEQPIKM